MVDVTGMFTSTDGEKAPRRGDARCCTCAGNNMPVRLYVRLNGYEMPYEMVGLDPLQADDAARVQLPTSPTSARKAAAWQGATLSAAALSVRAYVEGGIRTLPGRAPGG